MYDKIQCRKNMKVIIEFQETIQRVEESLFISLIVKL